MYNRITLGVLFVVMLFTLHSTWSVYQKQRESSELKIISEKKVQELELRNKEINDKIEALGTEEGLEKEIRSRFNVVKGEENMVVIVEDVAKETNASTTSQSLWKKIVNFFRR